MKEVVIKTDDATMRGLLRLFDSLLQGPLKNPKLSNNKDYKRHLEKFLHDVQLSQFEMILYSFNKS